MVSLVHSKPEAPFGTRTVAGSGLGRPGRGAGWLTLLPVVYGEGIVHANLRTVLSSCSLSSLPPLRPLLLHPPLSLIQQRNTVGCREGRRMQWEKGLTAATVRDRFPFGLLGNSYTVMCKL